MKTLKYLRYIAIHKYWVFRYCLKYGLIWRGLVHDLSKLMPSEFPAYRDYFYDKACEDTNKRFNYAWNAHQKHNKHHPQYWLLKNDDGTLKPLEMPMVYRKEMIADWRGASIAIKGYDNTLQWYTANKKKMIIAPLTRAWVEGQIGYQEDK